MRTKPPIEIYLGWLAPQAGVQRRPKKYNHLLVMLMEKEFVWLVPNDDSRIGDGLDIRREFCQEYDVTDEFGPCSVLEVIISLSRRLSFTVGGKEAQWAWTLICNLKLDKMSDPMGQRKSIKADEILETFIWRNYDADGCGGLFPLQWPQKDQRKVELWYQMAAYVEEIHPEY